VEKPDYARMNFTLQEDDMLNILVTSVGRGAGQAVIKSLRLADLDVRIIGTDADPWATGLYVADKSYLVPPCSDGNFVEKIMEICLKENVELIIPNFDPELIVFAENKSRFQTIGAAVIISDPNVMKICRNKMATYSFFHDKKLPFVETKLVSNIVSQPDADYPLFVKPIGGTGSSEIDVLFGPGDLDKYKNKGDQYIAQKYLLPSKWNIARKDLKREHIIRYNAPIQKDEVSTQFLVSHNGEIISAFMSISSLKHGIPVHITPMWDEEVYAISRQMVEALIPEGLVGAINLECKITDEGVFFYEINPRFTTLSAVRAMMGFNECAAMVEDIVFNRSARAIQSSLIIDFDSVCSRYVSEIVVRADYFSKLIQKGELDNTKNGTQHL
jgi:carbamoylphosphate synthase large subunit